MTVLLMALARDCDVQGPSPACAAPVWAGLRRRGAVSPTVAARAKAAPTGVALIAPGTRSDSARAACSANAGPSTTDPRPPANRPTTVGPEPLTSAASAPASRASRRTSAICGQSGDGGPLKVVVQQLAGAASAVLEGRACQLPAAPLELLHGARERHPVRLGVDGGGGQRGVERQDEQAEGGGRGAQLLEDLSDAAR